MYMYLDAQSLRKPSLLEPPTLSCPSRTSRLSMEALNQRVQHPEETLTNVLDVHFQLAQLFKVCSRINVNAAQLRTKSETETAS